MNAIDEAILRTIIYGDVFSFPMTPQEIHHFLISDISYDLQFVENALAHSRYLAQMVEQSDGLVALSGRGDLIPLRLQREQDSLYLMDAATRYGRWLTRMPFVRMVGLTGALAVHNAANTHDDIDYMLVTKAGRVWMARAFSILWVRIGKLRGVTLCPNFVLAETSLAHAPEDLYIAHEIAQLLPLSGVNIYQQMRKENGWELSYLANARAPFYSPDIYIPKGGWAFVKRCGEWILGGKLGDKLEAWEFRRKQAKFQPEIERHAHNSAEITDERVKGHFNNHGHPVMVKYFDRLRQYNLEAEPQAGD